MNIVDKHTHEADRGADCYTLLKMTLFFPGDRYMVFGDAIKAENQRTPLLFQVM